MSNLQDPPKYVEDVTPHDTNPFPSCPNSMAVYIGTAGDLTVRMTAKGNNITFPSLPAGGWFAVQCDRILVAGTSAGQLKVGW